MKAPRSCLTFLTCEYLCFVKKKHPKRSTHEVKTTHTYHLIWFPHTLTLRPSWGSKSTNKQSRNRIGFVHRHKLRHGTKIWQLGDIYRPIFRTCASRRKGKEAGEFSDWSWMCGVAPCVFLGICLCFLKDVVLSRNILNARPWTLAETLDW